MTRKQRNILIISAGLAAIGLMVLLLLRPRGTAPTGPGGTTGEKLPESILPAPPRAPAAANVAPEEKAKMQESQSRELEAKRSAQIFLERYGSFSNQSNYENISDLQPLMTVNMKKVADTYVREQKSLHPSSIGYYGITTKVISSSAVFSGETRATVTIETQRQESIGANASPRVLYQDATLKLIKLGSEWKIDDVVWGSVR